MPIFYEAFEFLASMLSYLYVMAVIRIFFRKSRHFRYWIVVSVGVLCTVLTTVPLAGVSNTVLTFVSIALIYIVSLLCFSGNPALMLLTIFIYHIFELLVGNIFYSLIHFMTGVSLSELSSAHNSTRIYWLATIYFTIFVFIFILHRIKNSVGRLNRTETIISTLFFVCDFFVCFLTYCVLFTKQADPRLTGICFILSALMLMATLLVLYLLRQLQYQNEHDLEIKLLSMQLTEQKMQFEQFHENMESLQTIRHDMKNHLLNYQILLDEGNVEEVQNDIKNIIGEYLSPDERIFTSHPMFNALLCSKYHTIEKHNIRLVTHIVLQPEYENLPLMTALSNLLDNAIDAVLSFPSEIRCIHFELIQVQHSLSILIRNPITGSVLADNPNLESTKSDKNLHGYGLKSVRHIIDSQNGIFQIFEENDWFCAQIYLP